MPSSPTIVSLIASATEIVCSLGLRDHLIGISHECDHPEDVKGLPILSEPKIDVHGSGAEIDRQVRQLVQEGLSVYRIRTDTLVELGPDLIVTQDHCQVCAVSLPEVEQATRALLKTETRICSLHPQTLADIVTDFRKVGRAANVSERAESLAATFWNRLDSLTERTRHAQARPRVLSLEWLEPPMVAGGWIPELVLRAGGQPLLVGEREPFRTVTWPELHAADPEIVAIFPCGYPIEKTLEEMGHEPAFSELRRLAATRNGNCFVCDGNAYFNRPGPRIADSAEILGALIHPKICAAEAGRYTSSFVRWP